MKFPGVGICGRTGSGKDYIKDILCSVDSHFTLVGVGRIIAKALEREVLHRPVDRTLDIPLMQKEGWEQRARWATASRVACGLLIAEHYWPVLLAVRTDCDVESCKALGLPIVKVHAPLEMRVKRVMSRDNVTRDYVMGLVNEPTEEYTDKILPDLNLENSGEQRADMLCQLFKFLDV